MQAGHVVIVLPIVGALLAVSYPVAHYMRTREREQAAMARLEALVRAQHAFRQAAGRGGFATSFDSLTAECPGGGGRALDSRPSDGILLEGGYGFTLRAAQGAASGPTDCHGRPTALDFVVSATPRRAGVDGTRSMSVMASGRVFVFVDPVAPAEADMAPGGLAVPLDAPVRIP